MQFLLVGNGGREHALAWKLTQSEMCSQLYVAPGNAGTADLPKTTNIDIDAIDIPKLIAFAADNNIDLIIPGPEAPLAMGLVDAAHAANLNCFGPSQASSRLESSKIFCKQLAAENNIPTPEYQTCDNLRAALEHLSKCKFPVVLKADGLAAGKGVIISHNLTEATAAATKLFDRYSGANPGIIIEEFVTGEEISFICICSGTDFVSLASSQDHKQRDAGDCGPNTGGMGAYSPAPRLTPELQQTIETTIISPTLKAMAKRGTPYYGFLYAGLMINDSNQPYLLEYNCRLGDPETQPLMLRLNSDLAQIFWQCRNQNWNAPQITWDKRPALGVVMASAGYPDSVQTGYKINGLQQQLPANAQIFQAGTKQQNADRLTNGGRVLCVTALADNLEGAQQTVYQIIKHISWPGAFYRNDIGHRALKPTSNQASEL